MRRAAVGFLLILSLTVWAQEDPDGRASRRAEEGPPGPPGAIFISSAPIRAEVTLDGTPVGTTPLFIQGVAAGTHQITLIKPGYLRQTASITLAPEETAKFTATLEPNVFVGAFASTETVVDGVTYSRQDSRLILPAGTYEFAQEGPRLTLDPVYPYESALRGLRVATPVIAVAAVIAIVEDLFVQDAARDYFTSYLPSPATFATWTAAATSTGFLIALNRDKQQYEARTVVRRYANPLTEAEAERFYLEGERALEAGNLETALADYTRVVTEGGDSEFVPLALYKAARIYNVTGEERLALPLFELLVRDYPVPETYDRSLKSIADIQVANGQYAQAIAALERMVFVDELYDRATVEADIAAIRELQSAEEAGE